MLRLMTTSDYCSAYRQQVVEHARHRDNQLRGMLQLTVLLGSAGFALFTQSGAPHSSSYDRFLILMPLAIAGMACLMGSLTNQGLVPGLTVASGRAAEEDSARAEHIQSRCLDFVIRENRHQKNAFLLAILSIAVAFLNFSLWLGEGALPTTDAGVQFSESLSAAALLVISAVFLRLWWKRSTGPEPEEQAELYRSGELLDLDGGHITAANIVTWLARQREKARKARARLRRG